MQKFRRNSDNYCPPHVTLQELSLEPYFDDTHINGCIQCKNNNSQL